MKELFTTFEIARLCKVDITTVINWIDNGKLLAYKTPGGHRRVRRHDFLKFLKAYELPVPRGIGTNHSILLIASHSLRNAIRKNIEDNWPEVEISETDDGFLAGKLLGEKQPVLVIFENELSGIDGLQVCRLIKSDRRLKNTKILVLAARRMQHDTELLIEAGADECIPSKPFSVGAVMRQIEKLLPE